MTVKRIWYPQMDGLRFIAVFMVLLEHFAFFIGNKIHAGFFGVDLFFVISGFLITEGLLNDKVSGRTINQSLVKFYLKRFLRIFPIYYLVLFLALIFSNSFRDVAIWAFTYTINYYTTITGKDIPVIFSHLWSLSVEEQFYIFWPFIILFFPLKKLLYILLFIFLGSVLYFSVYHDLVGLPGRMYSLCMGSILAYLKTSYPRKFSTNVRDRFLIILSLSIGLFFINAYLGLSLFSFGLVYLCSNNSYTGFFKKILENQRLSYWGRISYGIYLYHLPLAYLLSVKIFDPWWNKIDFASFEILKYHSWIIKLPFYSMVSIFLAHVSFTFIEKPILELKKRI